MMPDMTESTDPHATGAADPQRQMPWSRKKRFAFPSAVLLALLIIMISTGGNDPGIFDRTTSELESQAEMANQTEMANQSPAATIGQSVRDGAFSFVVTSVDQPVKTITSRLGTTEAAQGVFVIVRVSVTNIGYEPRTLTVTDQFFISEQGQRFATSPAIWSLPGTAVAFMKKVNPGHTVNDASIILYVHSGTRIARIELHDSGSSEGVKVNLS